MPACYSHDRLALEVASLHLDLDLPCFRLGSQGPDPFLYRGTLPWQGKQGAKEANECGEALHHADSYALYSSFLAECEDDAELSSYVYGLILHYCLDSTAHPYIFYRSGFEIGGGLKGFTKASHGHFEALVDRRLRQLDKTRGRVWGLRIGSGALKKIDRLWAESGLIGEGAFLSSYADFCATQAFLTSCLPLKRPLLRLLGENSLGYSMSYPLFASKVDGPIDCLNKSKAKWVHPSSGREDDKSYLELLSEAKFKFEAIFSRLKNGLDASAYFALDHDGDAKGHSKKAYSICFRKIPKGIERSKPWASAS